MSKKRNTMWILSVIMLALFGILISLLKFVDVQAIGPKNSSVGLASVNGWFQELFGFQQIWYDITEVLGTAVLGIALGFALLGVWQLLKRKSLKKVDKDLYLLAGFYVAMMVVYAIFEVVVINYRPVILENELEASFPSSHTILSVCILGTAIQQFLLRVRVNALRYISVIVCVILLLLVVVGRMLSGVHWFTDIVGGVLISLSLIFAYLGFYEKLK